MNKTINETTAAIILAAGRSQRMQQPKPWLRFDNNRTFLHKIIDEYTAFGCEEIIVILNEENAAGEWKKELSKIPGNTEIVINRKLQNERFYSVKLGVQQLQKAAFCFIHNVDNPFINPEILTHIYKGRTAEGYVSPVYKGSGGHPILIGREIIRHMQAIREDDTNLRHILKPYLCKRPEMKDDTVLININTKEQYKIFFTQRRKERKKL